MVQQITPLLAREVAPGREGSFGGLAGGGDIGGAALHDLPQGTVVGGSGVVVGGAAIRDREFTIDIVPGDIGPEPLQILVCSLQILFEI